MARSLMLGVCVWMAAGLGLSRAEAEVRRASDGTGSVQAIPFPQRKPEAEITPEEWAGMRLMTQRYPARDKSPGVTDGQYYVRYGGVAPRPRTWKDMTPAHLARCGQRSLAMLCELPRLYFSDPTEKGRQQAREHFVTLAKLFCQKEFSDSGATYMFGRVRFEDNLLPMAPVLKEAGIYEDFVRAFAMDKRFMTNENPAENMDWSRDRVPLAWALVAHLDDGPEKLYLLRLLQRATSLSHAKLISPDGGGLHHNCDHLSYASYSFGGVCRPAIRAYGTPFQLSDEVYRKLKTYAWVHGLATVGNEYPGNLAVRATLPPLTVNTEPWLRALADMTDPVDADLAAMYLAKFGDSQNEAVKATVQRYRDLGIRPYAMNAHHSYNISSAALHRRGKWLVALDGCRAPFKGIELYTWPGNDRTFMPNSAFGSLMILSAGRTGASGKAQQPQHGYTYAGWDHNHYAGVTAPVLPYEQLMTARRNEQVRNGSAYAGGTSLGPNGVWGLISVRYGQEICRQSAFFFDNRVTVLVSNVNPLKVHRDRKQKSPTNAQASADESVYPTHTTLFQFALEDHAEAIGVNGEPIVRFPYHQRLDLVKPVRLHDHKGNGYYVHANKGSVLHVARQTQQSFNFYKGLRKDTPKEIRKLIAKGMQRPNLKKVLEYCEPLSGDFSIAYLEHEVGTDAPTAAFTLFVQSDVPEGQPPYTILRQDKVAHLLRDSLSKTTGCVIFEPDKDVGPGLLKSVSRPSTVMLQEADDGSVHCSVSSTDAQVDKVLFQGGEPTEAHPAPMILTFRGSWTVRQAEREDLACERAGDTTVVTFPYKDYMPVRFSLQRA